jgi:hypothetical protein
MAPSAMRSLRLVAVASVGVYATFLAAAISIRSDDFVRPPLPFGTYYSMALIHRFSPDKFMYSSPVAPLFNQFRDSDYDRQHSPVVIYENDKPLPFPHARPDAIEDIGRGRYAHLGSVFLFSTSDNSDPTKNGRAYWVAIPNAAHLTDRIRRPSRSGSIAAASQLPPDSQPASPVP